MTSATQHAIDNLSASIGMLRDQVVSLRAAQEADVRVMALLHDRIMRLENIVTRYLDKESRA